MTGVDDVMPASAADPTHREDGVGSSPPEVRLAVDRCRDLRVDLTELSGFLTVRASAGDADQREATVDAAPLAPLHLRARRVAGKRFAWPDLLEFGLQLGRVLFPGEVRDLLAEGLSSLGDGERLRIRLCLQGGLLASLPWELAYVPSLDTEVRLGPYLVLDERVVLTRQVADGASILRSVPEPVASPTPSGPRLRTVVAPATALVGGIAALQSTEPLVIQRALASSDDHECVILADPVSVRVLRDALSARCDIFHFTGHAAVGAGLIVGSEEAATESLALHQLADLLADARTRLAVLSACDTGAHEALDTVGAVESLIAAGVRAVVAMQHSIEDSHAITFARAFYEALARRDPVEVAVARGRRAMCLLGLSSEWAVPVLYLGDEPPFPDQAGRGPVTVGDSPARRIRFRLPPVVPGFTGRDGELDALGAWSTETPVGVRCQFLSGMGGVGKTQLAAAYVAARAEVFDIVAWIRSERGPAADLAALGWQLGLRSDGRTPGEVAADVWAHLATTSRTWLVVLDNVDDLAMLRDVPVSGNGEVLVTTRVRGGREAIGAEVTVSTLDPEAAAYYLVARSGRVGEIDEATRLSEALGHLPLALAHAGSYCDVDSGLSFSEYRVMIDELRAEMLFDTSGELFYEQTVAATWTASIERAAARSSRSRPVLEAASFLAPDGIPRELFVPSDVTAVQRKQAVDALQALAGASLAEVDGRTVRVHRLLQKVVRDSLDEASTRQAVSFCISGVSRMMPDDPFDPELWPAWLDLAPHLWALSGVAHVDGIDGHALMRMLCRFVEFELASGEPAEALRAADLAVRASLKLFDAGGLSVVRARRLRLDALHLAGDDHAAMLEGEALVAEAAALSDGVALDVFAARCTLIETYEALRRSTQAIAHGEALLGALTTAVGPDHHLAQRSRRAVAASFLSVGRSYDAVWLLERAIDDLPDLSSVALERFSTSIVLAAGYRATGQIARAVTLGEALVRQCVDALGSTHLTTLSARFDLASTYRSAGRLDAAMAFEAEVVGERTRLLGPRHSDTLWAVGNLGLSYQSAGRTQEAIEVAEQVVADRREAFGDDHSTTLTAIANLAISLRAAGRFDEAIALQERLVTDRTRVIGAEHFSTLSARDHLGITYRRAGRTSEAVETAEAVVRDRRRVIGPEHPATLLALDNLAAAYRSAGRVDEAVATGRQVVTEHIRVLGTEHPETLWAKRNLAEASWLSGQHESAVELARQALDHGRRVLGDGHPYVRWISVVLECWERGDDAVAASATAECERMLWE